jgi:YfiH family protein
MRFSWSLIRPPAKETGLPIYAILCDGQGQSPAIVTTRKGGFSSRGGEGFNLSFKVGDHPNDVRENRELLLRTLGLREDEFARPEQVHGSLVLSADAPGEYRNADGLVLSKPGLWAAILVADCVPVFCFTEDFSVVGLAHAGRKGTRAGITKNLVKQVKSAFHFAPRQVFVALGPSIGPCCYELDSTTASHLPQQFITERERRAFFDLWSANAAQGMEEGILEENIVLPPACTCCQQDVFFSYRAQRGKAGRQMAITKPGGMEIGRDVNRSASH